MTESEMVMEAVKPIAFLVQQLPLDALDALIREAESYDTVGPILDPFRQSVLRRRFPVVEVIYSNVETIDPATLAPVDVIIGGFPCPDISTAGLRAGITGSRSGLWRQMVRAIRVVRPRYAVVENVAALLGRGMGTVLGDLAEGGYDTAWDCLPAVAFGALHERDRVFIVAHADEGDGEAGLGDQSHGPESVFAVDYRECPRLHVQAAGGSAGRDDGLPAGLYRSRVEAIGDSVFVPVAEWIARRILAVMP
jgi:DNA (cytosine-5)-methyltransferase 1